MSSEGILDMSAHEMAAAIRARNLSPVEAVGAVIERIESLDPGINAFITVLADGALEAARQAEREVMHSEPDSLGILHGVPVSVKDLTDTKGVRTTYGTVEHADNVPEADGLTWARLKSAGAILTGKTSTPPFGALCVTENDIVGRTNNPWNPSRTVGGSSGGSGAALAARFGPIALASDGGGSIRVPASYCGVVGLKASRGRIPLFSEGPPFETVDVVGPMSRTVVDSALMLTVLSGPHSHDPYSLLEAGVDYHSGLDHVDVKGLKIALCFELGRGPIESDVRANVSAAALHFANSLGAHVDEVEMAMPAISDYFMTYWAPNFSLFMNDLGYDFSRYPPLMDWIERGAQVSAVDHLRTALIDRAAIHSAFADVFDEYDIIITPTTPQTAFEHPSPSLLGPRTVAGVDVELPAIDFSRFTDPPSNAGYPAISIPCGLSPEGLPVGLQIIGRHGADRTILEAAAAFEKTFGSPVGSPDLERRAS